MQLLSLVLAVCLTAAACCYGAEGNLATLDPVAWRQEPHARVSTEVTMAAKEIGKLGSVEYRFECAAGPGHSGGWQGDPQYTDSALEPLTDYTYVAHVRDKRTEKEIAEPSRPVTVKTRAAKRGPGVASTHVEAIDKAIASGRLEMIPLMVTGDKDNRINIVAINRWRKGQRNAYNRPELRDEFIEDARHVLGAFTADHEETIPPYPTYRGFFNVYAVWWPDVPPWDPKDREHGMHWADYNEIRARLFLPWQVEGKGWVTHLAMFNGSGGGGGAGRRLDERVGDAMIVGNRIRSFIHEFNHTAPGIPDEYTSSGMWGRGGEGSTTTNDYRREHVKWRAWIDADTPVPTPYSRAYLDKVGVFEGGVHRMAHLFRPTARGCLMGSGSFAGNPTQMCAVCRQRAVQRFYHWVDAIDETKPARRELAIDGSSKLSFSVKRLAPQPDTQKSEWRLNGRVVATMTDAVELAFGDLAEYEVTFSLTDESPFIRPDPPHARYPREEVRWRITNTKPTSRGKPLPVAVENPGPKTDATVVQAPMTPRIPGFTLAGLRFEKAGPTSIRIANAKDGYRYLWYANDLPSHLPRFPHGIYEGTFAAADGRKCDADAFVIQNKGGMFVDERKTKNNLGHWIHLMAYTNGRTEEPLTVDVNTTQEGRLAQELLVASHKHDDTTWSGKVADGRLHLHGVGPKGGTFDLVFASHPATPDQPVHVGQELSPKAPGNYYVAAQKVESGVVSSNRVGVAIAIGPTLAPRRPVTPDQVKSAKLLLWLDASDMDGDGTEDAVPPRRGAVMGWQGKAGGVNFKDFVFFLPNEQNGKGVASWQTIWVQNLSAQVKGFQTIFIVRREHDLSSVGTAPWRDLNGLMGVGEYGKQLLSEKVSDEIHKGAVYVNGAKVDPFATPMPTGFYLATYEFSQKVSRGFRTTEGHYEGSIAECLVYDGKLTQAEREGVETYLHRKWLSAVHLDGPHRD